MSTGIQECLATNSKQVTAHEFCTVWANKCLVCSGVQSTELSLGDNSPQRRGELSSGSGSGGGGAQFVSTVSNDTVFFVAHCCRDRLLSRPWNKTPILRCTSFSRPKGTLATTDEDLFC